MAVGEKPRHISVLLFCSWRDTYLYCTWQPCRQSDRSLDCQVSNLLLREKIFRQENVRSIFFRSVVHLKFPFEKSVHHLALGKYSTQETVRDFYHACNSRFMLIFEQNLSSSQPASQPASRSTVLRLIKDGLPFRKIINNVLYVFFFIAKKKLVWLQLLGSKVVIADIFSSSPSSRQCIESLLPDQPFYTNRATKSADPRIL